MNLELTNQMIARVNLAISAFNKGNDALFLQAVATVLEMAGNDEIPYAKRIAVLGELRSLAALRQDIDSLTNIDAALYGFLGDGINQFSEGYDLKLRELINQAIQLANQGDRPGAIDVMNKIIALSQEEPGLAANHADVCKPMISVAAFLDNPQIVAAAKDIDARVLAQKALIDSSRVSMPLVEFDAIDYPSVVTVETFMKCNAKCHFCPYPEMEEQSERSGVRLPTELFEKLVNDLTDIPKTHQFQMNLSRVNEPLLDSRLFDFLDLVEERLPNVTIFLPSNGSTLTEKNVRKLMALKRFEKLMVSLNAIEAEAYENIMALPFDKTIANLDRMHAIEVEEGLGFNVVLTAVMSAGEDFDRFTAWCGERYPKFFADRYAPTDWFGRTSNESQSEHFRTVSCKDYYQLHILADGREAQCCFDSEGQFGEGNIKEQHALEIYNKDWQRKLRRHTGFRGSDFAPEYCRNCDHG